MPLEEARNHEGGQKQKKKMGSTKIKQTLKRLTPSSKDPQCKANRKKNYIHIVTISSWRKCWDVEVLNAIH